MSSIINLIPQDDTWWDALHADTGKSRRDVIHELCKSGHNYGHTSIINDIATELLSRETCRDNKYIRLRDMFSVVSIECFEAYVTEDWFDESSDSELISISHAGIVSCEYSRDSLKTNRMLFERVCALIHENPDNYVYCPSLNVVLQDAERLFVAPRSVRMDVGIESITSISFMRSSTHMMPKFSRITPDNIYSKISVARALKLFKLDPQFDKLLKASTDVLVHAIGVSPRELVIFDYGADIVALKKATGEFLSNQDTYLLY